MVVTGITSLCCVWVTFYIMLRFCVLAMLFYCLISVCTCNSFHWLVWSVYFSSMFSSIHCLSLLDIVGLFCFVFCQL